MSIVAKFQLEEKDGAIVRANIPRILEKILHEGAEYVPNTNPVILTVTLPNRKMFMELKRRLGAKRNRPGTMIKILDFKETR